MKIVLAGTPQIAIETFEEIIKHHNVLAIITQPDKKKGRGLQFQESPVAKLGLKYNIDVLKPQNIDDIYNYLKKLNFDLFLTFAYGQWIPTQILKLGNFDPINIHPSLLPKYRGAAPIHHALLNGDNEIGVSIIQMIKKMDAGDIYFQVKTNINENTNLDEAVTIVSKLCKKNIIKWLLEIEKNLFCSKKQSSNFTIAPKIQKIDGLIDQNLTIYEAKRKIRAMTSIPGAFTFFENKRYKLFDYTNLWKNGCLKIKLKDGIIFINDFQKEGKKRHQINI